METKLHRIHRGRIFSASSLFRTSLYRQRTVDFRLKDSGFERCSSRNATRFSLLPPAYEVRREVMFSQACVCPLGDGVPPGLCSFPGGTPGLVLSCNGYPSQVCIWDRGYSEQDRGNPFPRQTGNAAGGTPLAVTQDFLV